MEIVRDRINDIFAPVEWEKIYPIDLLGFFPRYNLKAIRLNQAKLFSDIYLEELPEINLSLKKKIKISKYIHRDLADIVKKDNNWMVFNILLKRRKERILQDPINLLEPLLIYKRNILDIRDLQIIQSTTIYPDLYKLPLRPKQKVKKFYRENGPIIKKWFSKWTKYAIILSILIVSSVLSLVWYRNYIKWEVTKLYQELYAIKNIKDPAIIEQNARKIKNNFLKVELVFSPINIFWNNFIYSNQSIRMVSNLIYWWKNIAEMLVVWGSIWKDFNKEINDIVAKNWWENLVWFNSIKWLKFTEFFKKEENNLIAINEKLKTIILEYSQIETLWSEEIDNKFQITLESIIKAQKYLNLILENKEIILRLTWDTKPVRYFILNQNKDEIRANWGFPWSVVTLELYKWSILNYEKKDIYFYDWNLTWYRETPPEWLNIISPNHWLRDANYNPLFLDSVRKINFFYEKSWWWTIDNVIWINQWIIEDLLKKYWPVHMDEINLDITDKNFSTIMSILVENKFQKVDSPKDILFKFTEKFEKKLFEKKDFLGYIEIFYNNFIAWEIPIASLDKDIQEYLDSLDILEKWTKDKWNWVYPIFTSISWNKSDRYMNRYITLDSQKTEWCKVLNDFSITSTHNYNENTRESLRKIFDNLKITDASERNRLIWIQWASENRQFVRVLVPKWSIIADSNKYNINTDDSDPRYTFFKFYIKTDVWQTSNIKFQYINIPPNCQEKPTFYKQPWLSNYTFN